MAIGIEQWTEEELRQRQAVDPDIALWKENGISPAPTSEPYYTGELPFDSFDFGWVNPDWDRQRREAIGQEQQRQTDRRKGYEWEDWLGYEFGEFGHELGEFDFEMADWGGTKFGEAPKLPLYDEYGQPYPEMLDLPRYERYDEPFPEMQRYESEMLGDVEQLARDLMAGKDVGIPEEGIQWQRAMERVGKAEQAAQEELTRLSARGGRMEGGLYGQQQAGIVQKGLEERRYMAQDFAIRTAEMKQEAKQLGAQIGLSYAQFESDQNVLIYGAERDAWQAGMNEATKEYQFNVAAGMAEQQAKERAWQAGMNEYTKAYESRFNRAQQEYDWFKNSELVRAQQEYDWFKTAETTEQQQQYDWFKNSELMGAQQAYDYFTMQQGTKAQQEYDYFTMQQGTKAQQRFAWDMSDKEYQQQLQLMEKQAKMNEPTFGDYIWSFLTGILGGLF